MKVAVLGSTDTPNMLTCLSIAAYGNDVAYATIKPDTNEYYTSMDKSISTKCKYIKKYCNVKNAVDLAEIIVVCVDTYDSTNNFNMSSLLKASGMIARNMNSCTAVIIKSIIPEGLEKHFETIIRNNTLQRENNFRVISDTGFPNNFEKCMVLLDDTLIKRFYNAGIYSLNH